MPAQETALRLTASLTTAAGFIGYATTIPDKYGWWAMWIWLLLGGAIIAGPMWARYLAEQTEWERHRRRNQRKQEDT